MAFAANAAEGDAQPVEGLKPMAFLAGHCWKGDFPEKAQNDEHCFQWVYGGKGLRDMHTVHAPGRPDYLGETMYYWDSAAKQVGYLYIENLGGISRGTMESTPGALVFPATQYIANGQDPEHGEGVGHLYAIDATKRGDITQSGRVWHFDKIRRAISTAAVADGLVYVADFSGYLHCLDAKTGQEYWVHDALAAVWGSPFVADGKVYLGDEDGDIVVLQHGKELKVIAEMNMGSSTYATPVPANGTLFVMNRNQIWALSQK
jgi:hypothetical protein